MKYYLLFVTCILPAIAKEPPPNLAALESMLLEASVMHVEVNIDATGAVTSHFEGTLTTSADNRVALACEGSFMGNKANPKVTGDGTHMHSPKGQQETPPDLAESMVLGFIRQGLLHTLAVVSSGAAPDGIHGSVKKRFILVDQGPAKKETLEGRPVYAYTFRLDVEGTPTGTGTIYIDASTHYPVLRKQKVQFPQGEMVVTERYPSFRLGGSFQ